MKQSIAGIIRRENSFLIGKRLPTGEMGGRWEFPGGKVDGDETPEAAIAREFREELGIAVSVGQLIAKAIFSNKHGPVELLAYEVEIPPIADFELTEHVSVDWATLDRIESLDFVDSDRLLIPEIRKWYNL
jgi:8-oxo-dGTP diphosphatase